MIRLSGRMREIASLCPKSSILYDVGCDHALISIYLISAGVVDFVTASDINRGPLETAEKNARKEGVSDRMSFILSDGLKMVDINQDKTDTDIHSDRAFRTLLISGMGGELIKKILEDGRDKLDKFDCFIFSPHSKPGDFRRYLGSAGICIKEERLIKDDGKFYFLIKAGHGSDACHKDTDYEFGPYFFDGRDSLKEEYLSNGLAVYERLYKDPKITGDGRIRIEKSLNLYREALRRYEMS